MIALFCILIGIVLSNQIVNILAPDFEGETYKLTVYFLKIYMWSILFNSLTRVLIAYLNCNNRFYQSSISALALSSIQMIFIIILLTIISPILNTIVTFRIAKGKPINLKDPKTFDEKLHG